MMKGKSMKNSKRMLKLVVIFAVVGLFMLISINSVFAKEITLTVRCWEYQQKCINACLDKFYELYPEIKIEFEVMGPAEVYEKLLLDISAGEGAPDVTGCENSHLAQFVALGGLYDITGKKNLCYALGQWSSCYLVSKGCI